MTARTYLIAEAGVNHNGDPGLAMRMISVAKQAGADAVKFQYFNAERLASPAARKAAYQDRNAPEAGDNQLEMLKKLELSLAQFEGLKAECDRLGIDFLCTPFDEICARELAPLMKAFKVPSGEITHLPFLRYLASFKKPVILSTGMATLSEVDSAVQALEGSGPVTILHCTSNYPCPWDEVNLKAMVTLREVFRLPVGYSDHTLGNETAIAAVALGAVLLEKHFTLDKGLPGPDHAASLDPLELKQYVDAVRRTEILMGNGMKHPTAAEVETAARVRKSLVWAKDLPAGTNVEPEMMTFKRPGCGMPPSKFQDLVGKKLKVAVGGNVLVRPSDFVGGPALKPETARKEPHELRP